MLEGKTALEKALLYKKQHNIRVIGSSSIAKMIVVAGNEVSAFWVTVDEFTMLQIQISNTENGNLHRIREWLYGQNVRMIEKSNRNYVCNWYRQQSGDTNNYSSL